MRKKKSSKESEEEESSSSEEDEEGDRVLVMRNRESIGRVEGDHRALQTRAV